MHKSTRFEFRKHPWYEVPNKETRKFLNRIHRTEEKRKIQEGMKEYETKDK